MTGQWRLLVANLARSPARIALLATSIGVASFLFATLRSIDSALADGLAREPYLMVFPAPGRTRHLTISDIDRIRELPGVATVTSFDAMSKAYFQDVRTPLSPLAVVMPDYAAMHNTQLAEDALHCFAETLRGALVDGDLAARHGWKVGGIVPIMYGTPPSTVEFVLCGTFDSVAQTRTKAYFLYRLEYTGAHTAAGAATFLRAYAAPNANPRDVAGAIDELTAQTAYRTQTISQEEFLRSRAQLVESAALIFTSVLAATAGSLVLLVGTSAGQAIEERTGEIATCRAVGFSGGSMLALLVAEHCLLVLGGVGIGLGGAWVLEAEMNNLLTALFGPYEVSLRSMAETVAVLGGALVLAGLLPAVGAVRRPVAGSLLET